MDRLEDIRWHRIRVALRNTRNRFAKEHPLFVMRAILLSARGSRPEGEIPKPVFRFSSYPGHRVKLGHKYEFSLLFKAAEREGAERMRGALSDWLSDGANHFTLESAEPPEERSLAALRAEHPLDAASDEVCLDFITPFSFTPTDKQAPWSTDVLRLGEMLARRVEAAGGPLLCPPDSALRCMPWYLGDLERHVHSKGNGVQEFLSGFRKQLYLRGAWQDWEPWLRIASEWLMGSGTTKGQGAFRLDTARTFFDSELPNRTRYEHCWKEYTENTDKDDPFTHAYNDPGKLAGEIASELSAGAHAPAPARLMGIPKPSGKKRYISLLEPRDMIIQRALHGMLALVLDRSFENSSMGFRSGRSVEMAAAAVKSAVADGCDHVVESDIESFFDDIPWEGLERAIDGILPRADRMTRAALGAIMRTPVASGGRTRGLLQGSPLSPLLANVFLSPLDREIASAGFARYVRYGDDFVILVKGEEEANRALATVRDKLESLGLSLNVGKTYIRPVSLGFRFLGFNLGGELEDTVLAKAALRRTVILRAPWGFVGVDHDSVTVRRKGELVGRIPFTRIGQLSIHGPFGLSTALLHACSKRGIPVSLCTPAGHHQNTIRPDKRLFLERSARHFNAWTALGVGGRLRIAISALEGKLSNQILWLKRLPNSEAKQAAADLGSILSKLPIAESTEALMGMEGNAARRVFQTVNRLVHVEGFRSSARIPRKKPDRWNALLDFGYSQLFSLINVMLRSDGLNPYLGFLHSADDTYESLVADLQEPFRPRIDRWAVRSVNLQTIKAEHFESKDGGGAWNIVHGAYPDLLESFACELDRSLDGDKVTLLDLIRGQVMSLTGWVDRQEALHFNPPSAGKDASQT